MSVQREPVPSPGFDSDTTAELPALDVASYEAQISAEAAAASAGDTWIHPVPAVADDDPLRRRVEELEAEAAAACAERDDLRAQLTVAEERARHSEERLAERSLAAQALEARGMQLAADAERLRGEARQLRETLAERDVQLAQRANELVVRELRLAEVEPQLAARTQEIAAVAVAGEALGQRMAEAEDALTAARAEIVRLESESAGLRSERDRSAIEIELRGAALQDARAEIDELRRRTTAYLEALQSNLGRHEVYQSASAEYEAQLVTRDARIADLGRELTQRTAQVQELESVRDARDRRIGELESDLASERHLRDGQTQESSRAGEARAQLESRVQVLENSLSQKQADLAALAGEVEAARAREVRQDERLAELDRQLALAEKHAEEQGRTSTAVQMLLEQAEARVNEHRLRADGLQDSLDVLRAQLAGGGETGSDERATASELEAIQAELREARMALEEVRMALQKSQAAHEESRVALEAARTDVVDTRRALEEARAALAERDANIERLRSEAAGRAAALAAVPQPMPRTDALAQSGSSLAAEGPVRLLVRSEGGAEVMHVLGRRTTIGRTPDNDLQIDTRFISRHHAVVLAGPAQTIIEDLASTNGVLVNDRRITRKALRDGDTVLIGKTQFRFVVRALAE